MYYNMFIVFIIWLESNRINAQISKFLLSNVLKSRFELSSLRFPLLSCSRSGDSRLDSRSWRLKEMWDNVYLKVLSSPSHSKTKTRISSNHYFNSLPYSNKTKKHRLTHSGSQNGGATLLRVAKFQKRVTKLRNWEN